MVWTWVIGIHAIELIAVGLFFLVRRNNVLEKAVIQQQQHLDAIIIIIENSQQKLEELDSMGAFKSDDEVGTFFRNLKEMQDLLNEFNTRK